MVIWFCRRRHRRRCRIRRCRFCCRSSRIRRCSCSRRRRRRCRRCRRCHRRHRRVLKVDVMLHELKLQIRFSSAERSDNKFRQEKVPGIRKLLFLRTEFETSWELRS